MPIDPMTAPADDVIAAFAGKPPAPTGEYVAVIDGMAVGRILWDGVSPYEHPGGAKLYPAGQWRGPDAPSVETPDEAARRTRTERARLLRAQLRDDLAVVDTATIAQLRSIVRRVIRAERLLLALATEDQDDDG